MPARVRWRGTTAARGYGRSHQVERERRLAAYRPGDVCAHGGEQMWYWPLAVACSYLHLPHNASRTGYLPGLSCARHNLADGAVRGNKMRGRARTQTWRTSRQW